jgi:hypothetical protein
VGKTKAKKFFNLLKRRGKNRGNALGFLREPGRNLKKNLISYEKLRKILHVILNLEPLLRISEPCTMYHTEKANHLDCAGPNQAFFSFDMSD